MAQTGSRWMGRLGVRCVLDPEAASIVVYRHCRQVRAQYQLCSRNQAQSDRRNKTHSEVSWAAFRL